MPSWRVCVTLFLICSAGIASESRLPFGTVFKGQDQFNRLVAKAKAENWKSPTPIGDRTAAVGKALVSYRYKHFTLEIDNRIESPSVNFYGMDCWNIFRNGTRLCANVERTGIKLDSGTFVYIEIENQSYRASMHGRLSFRLHYLEDWLYDNDTRVLVSDMTRQLRGAASRTLRAMTVGWRHYRYLAANRSLLGPLARMEANVSSDTSMKFQKARWPRSSRNWPRSGDVIGVISRERNGLHSTAHVGLTGDAHE